MSTGTLGRWCYYSRVWRSMPRNTARRVQCLAGRAAGHRAVAEGCAWRSIREAADISLTTPARCDPATACAPPTQGATARDAFPPARGSAGAVRVESEHAGAASAPGDSAEDRPGGDCAAQRAARQSRAVSPREGAVDTRHSRAHAPRDGLTGAPATDGRQPPALRWARADAGGAHRCAARPLSRLAGGGRPDPHAA